MKYMLEGFTTYGKYDVLKIQCGGGTSALHYAAWCGYTSIITYLLTDFFQQQKYNLLQLQDDAGNTPLYRAGYNQKPEAVQAILTSLSPQQQIQLLKIKNKNGQTVTDIRPEVYNEYPLMISQGIVILQLKCFQV